MKQIGIGLIGAGTVAYFHMQGYRSIREAYGDIEPRFVVVSARTLSKAQYFCERFGYERCTTDWREVVQDPEVEVVLVTTPNFQHAEMVIEAAKAGKHVMCEKPMAMTKEEGEAMCRAVEEAGVASLVNFIYVQCPTVVETRRMIEEGELGDVVTFRGWFDASYKADPNSPMEWRQYRKLSGRGALGDVTAHAISLSDYLVNGQTGGIEEICACMDIVVTERPDPNHPGQKIQVENDDLNYILVRYKNGRLGILYASRVSTGHDCRLGYKVIGTKGSAEFSVDRMNELKVYQTGGNEAEKGFKTWTSNTRHGEYRRYSAYDDNGISLSDVFGIQAHSFLKAILEGKSIGTDVGYGYYVDRVMDAVEVSAQEKRWVKIEEMR